MWRWGDNLLPKMFNVGFRLTTERAWVVVHPFCDTLIKAGSLLGEGIVLDSSAIQSKCLLEESEEPEKGRHQM
jgi:hypothetical protein